MPNRQQQQQSTIDRDWFFKKLEERRRSLRGLAKHLNVDASAVSRMFSGLRRMQMEEATEIASFLGEPVSEVLAHAGVPLEQPGKLAAIRLAATINEEGALTSHPPRDLPPELMERAQAAVMAQIAEEDGTVTAAQIRASHGPLSALDDTIVLYQESDRIAPGAVDTLSVCRSIDRDQFIARVERTRKTGEARLICVKGEIIDAVLISATPILAMIP